MSFCKIKTPFVSNENIEKEAEIFRNLYWDGKIPVDIERIIEVNLKMNIIPVKNMTSYCDTEAHISSDWKNIHVDADKFCDERYVSRLRFSFAHEIGHFRIHKDLYESFNIVRVEDFYNFIKEIDEKEYGYLETQAHKFACALLLPRTMLIADANYWYRFLSEVYNLEGVKWTEANAYIAKPIAEKYGVSQEAAEIALNSVKRISDKFEEN